MDETTADVAIVGGGIAGGALAGRLAPAAFTREAADRMLALP